MHGYWIAFGEVWDMDEWRKYMAANAAAFDKYGARFLVRGGRSETVEGEGSSRSVVIEFPSYEAALACYRSPEYQEAKQLREGHGRLTITVVEGFEAAG